MNYILIFQAYDFVLESYISFLQLLLFESLLLLLVRLVILLLSFG